MTAAAAVRLADGRCLRMLQLPAAAAAAAAVTLAGAPSRAAQKQLER